MMSDESHRFEAASCFAGNLFFDPSITCSGVPMMFASLLVSYRDIN
jgi:hypothetical protein